MERRGLASLEGMLRRTDTDDAGKSLSYLLTNTEGVAIQLLLT
jgi:hypothetical protein